MNVDHMRYMHAIDRSRARAGEKAIRKWSLPCIKDIHVSLARRRPFTTF